MLSLPSTAYLLYIEVPNMEHWQQWPQWHGQRLRESPSFCFADIHELVVAENASHGHDTFGSLRSERQQLYE
jgi:hypothetical protein